MTTSLSNDKINNFIAFNKPWLPLIWRFVIVNFSIPNLFYLEADLLWTITGDYNDTGRMETRVYTLERVTSTSCTLGLLYLSVHVNLPRVIKYKNSLNNISRQPTFKAKDMCGNQVVSDPALRSAIVVVLLVGCCKNSSATAHLQLPRHCSRHRARSWASPTPYHRQSGDNRYLESWYWQEILIFSIMNTCK